MKDFYYILGLEANCTPDEIREAYRKLSKKFHPDLNQRDNYFENRFKEIRQAYETLIDPPGRAAYDSLLKKSKSVITQKDTKKPNYASTTKSIDIAFTIMLVLFTFLFGDYVVKTITGSKSVKTAAEVPVVKHHKKKHVGIIKSPGQSIATAKKTEPIVKPIINTDNKVAAQPQPFIKSEVKPVTAIAPPAPKPISSPTVITTPQPAPIVAKMDNPNILTGAYIKSNATGVVYMRQADNYNSAIVSRIPGNSRIAILKKGDNFYKISFNNQTGYVPKWTVKTD